MSFLWYFIPNTYRSTPGVILMVIRLVLNTGTDWGAFRLLGRNREGQYKCHRLGQGKEVNLIPPGNKKEVAQHRDFLIVDAGKIQYSCLSFPMELLHSTYQMYQKPNQESIVHMENYYFMIPSAGMPENL